MKWHCEWGCSFLSTLHGTWIEWSEHFMSLVLFPIQPMLLIHTPSLQWYWLPAVRTQLHNTTQPHLSLSLPLSLGFTIVASMHYNCQWPLVLHVDDKAIRRVVIQQWWNETKWSASSRSTRYTVMISLHGFILNRKQAQKRLSNWFCFPAGSLPKQKEGKKLSKLHLLIWAPKIVEATCTVGGGCSWWGDLWRRLQGRINVPGI